MESVSPLTLSAQDVVSMDCVSGWSHHKQIKCIKWCPNLSSLDFCLYNDITVGTDGCYTLCNSNISQFCSYFWAIRHVFSWRQNLYQPSLELEHKEKDFHWRARRQGFYQQVLFLLLVGEQVLRLFGILNILNVFILDQITKTLASVYAVNCG